MPEDEFRTDLQWPTDPLGERDPAGATAGEDVERVSEVWTKESRPSSLPSADRSSRPEVDAYEQLRQLRSTVEDLRRDMNGLRRSVMEWPELERVSSDVAALRADVGALLARGSAASGTARTDKDEASGQNGEALSELREEISLLRRRISLRAKDSVPLSEDDIDRLADALIERGVIPSDRQRR